MNVMTETVGPRDEYGLESYLDPTSYPSGLGLDALETIPVIDAGPAYTGTPGAIDRLAAEVYSAHKRIGFLAIVNHGVPQGIIDAAYTAIREFFDQPMAEKMKIRCGELSSGYTPAQSTIYVSSPVNNNTKGDLNENLRIVRERPADHPAIVAGMRFHGPNQWPNGVPGFKPRMLAYYNAMEALGRRLLPAYARALDLPANWFDAKFTDPMWSTRNSFYPANGGIDGAEENQFGIAPHYDHGFITLLPVSKEPGLEVLARTGRWVPVKIPDGAILVNTGEFMHRWTNGCFFATPHRVQPPKNKRYSLGFFFNPNADVSCTPLETCCGTNNPPKYTGMSMHDYLSWYVDRNYMLTAGGKQEPN